MSREEDIAKWEAAGLCWRCGHAIAAHDPVFGCDYEVRDYGEMDCGCEEYPKPEEAE